MRIAIVQNSIIYGGRLSVIVAIIEVLNRRGIIPDILTLRTDIDLQRIRHNYKADIDFRIRIIESPLAKLRGEIGIAAFGLTLRKIYKEYDYLIDSNNTSFLMPSGIPIFSYIHFPRIARIKSRLISIHHPQGPQKTWFDKEGILLKIIGLLYSFHTLKKSNYLTANSNFTLSYIRKHYPSVNQKIPVIYPPVRTDTLQVMPLRDRRNAICSMGRFCEGKNQLGQIQIAQRLPDLHFYLIGFSDKNNSYLELCQNYVGRNSIKNVHFYVNASYREKCEVLKKARFFLHPTVNEPFGIATVESIFAGCLPLVHNSGGQLEIIPMRDLRFDHLDEIEGILSRASKSVGYYDTVQKKLVDHCRARFSADVFKRTMQEHVNIFESTYL